MEQNGHGARIRRTKQEIEKLLADFHCSDLTVVEFCNQHKLSKGTFHQWKTRHGSQQAGFAQVEVREGLSMDKSSLFAEVRGIKIYQVVSAGFLKELLG